ncbi:MAG: hypothetical protein LUF25_00730 [Phascolarctobacterium sp.]|nr:hypothetical protein [Phascolarctobacterium sp.]
MIRASAELYDVEVDVKRDGSSPAGTTDKELGLEVASLQRNTACTAASLTTWTWMPVRTVPISWSASGKKADMPYI